METTAILNPAATAITTAQNLYSEIAYLKFQTTTPVDEKVANAEALAHQLIEQANAVLAALNAAK